MRASAASCALANDFAFAGVCAFPICANRRQPIRLAKNSLEVFFVVFMIHLPPAPATAATTTTPAPTPTTPATKAAAAATATAAAKATTTATTAAESSHAAG